MDPKTEAFVSRKCPEIFHSIEHTNDIWLPDPFDVPSIHVEARESFGQLVEQARARDIVSGRILVILGEAGAGKTHLMRAFRNTVHDEESAFFAYMQMTTSAQNYERYILQNLIDSLQQPYRPLERKTSLQVLSDRLMEMLPAKRVEALRSCESGPDAAPIVHELTDRLIDRNDLPPVDPDLIRALLFLQVGRPSVMTKVYKYLRAETLSDYDRNILGGIAPLHAEDAPVRLITSLARLIRTPLNRALVICADQLEDIFNLDGAKERFPRVMSAMTAIAELPSVVVVISCLEHFYVNVKSALATSTIHRLEQDPAPVRLSGARNRVEADAMIALRLNRLWEETKVAERNTTTPFPEAFLKQVVGQHTRAILSECLRFRTRSIEYGKLAELETLAPQDTGTIPPNSSPSPGETQLIQAWNDLKTEPQTVPEEEEQQRDLLKAVLPLAQNEVAANDPLNAVPAGPNFLKLSASWLSESLVAVTESNPQGGGLIRQMESAQGAAGSRVLVLVRSDTFAKHPRARTNIELGRIQKRGGRGVIVSDTDWRSLVAFRKFHAENSSHPEYQRFCAQEKPLLSLKSVKEILDADTLELARNELDLAAHRAPPSVRTGGSQTPPPPPRPVAAQPKAEPQTGLSPAAVGQAPEGPVQLGATLGHRPASVSLEVSEFRRHAAFLGSTGSGKTTAAMMVIEQLLARKIPAILVDRKGDLCGYGLPSVWTSPIEDPERAALRDRIRAVTEVEIYTPGAVRGRNLGVPLAPNDLRDLGEDEQESAARIAADGLSAMMNYGTSQAHQGGKVAIAKAIRYLSAVGESPNLESIIELLNAPDDGLVGELGSLTKFCERTVTDLEILKAGKAALLGGSGETLDVDQLLAPRADGRVPLSIVSTKFLGGDSDVQFWVAQLLVQVNRWLDKHPSSELQGVVLLDEADLYLPATRNPASKKPVEDLLRRARSKGFGVFLATQSPGDLDYKCRDNVVTWLVGLIAQSTALKKLEPMFRDAHVDPERLASQKVGEFHLLHQGQVRTVKTRMNAVPLPSQVADDEILRLARAGARAR